MDINELNGLLKKGYGGRELTSFYSGNIDALLKSIFSAAFEPSRSHAKLCLIAVGGYGRGDLAPFSDIDIMLFARDRSAAGTAKELLYKFWDSKLDISHSFRTPSDCIDESKRDIRTRTSLLEHRYVAGDEELYSYFRENVYPEAAFRNQKRFVMEKLREAEARQKRYGGSVFMLEPNVKEGKGGLRDIHNIIWLSSVKYRVGHFDELAKILAQNDLDRIKRAYDFLLKVRFCLHLLSGRRNDTLSFEFHDRIAGMLNFRDSKKFLAAERFMRYFYLKASIINDVSSHAVDICSLPYVSLPLHIIKKKITDVFCISKDRIAYTGEALKDADRIIEAFSVMAKTGKKFSPRLKEEIKKNLTRITRKTGSSRKAIELFRGILNSGRVYGTLAEMHHNGVLGRFIPEFGALSFLVVYEPYHRYTVDEHSLLAVKKIEELGDTRYKNLEHLSSIYKRIKSKEALILALLLHDIGKKGISKHYRFPAGFKERRHEGEGYLEIKNILERFNLDIVMRNRVEFLVRNHTLMSAIAFKQEIDDPLVISQFAEEACDAESLDALYLLTYADMASVSPDFWTEWKSYQLRDLYEAASRCIGGLSDRNVDSISGMFALSDAEKAGLQGFISNMPERYAISTQPQKVYDDYKLSSEVIEKGFVLRASEGNGGTAEIIVGTFDRPGLFSRIVGVLSSMGMSIYSARVYTGRDGLVIDKIQVSNYKALWWDGMFNALKDNIEKAVLGGDEQGFMTGSKRGIPVASMTSERVMPFVELDNETSQDSSILEFFAQDRMGLLYDASILMYRQGIDIISARINTESGLAHDVFSLQKGGNKIEGIAVNELLASLWENLS